MFLSCMETAKPGELPEVMHMQTGSGRESGRASLWYTGGPGFNACYLQLKNRAGGVVEELCLRPWRARTDDTDFDGLIQ